MSSPFFQGGKHVFLARPLFKEKKKGEKKKKKRHMGKSRHFFFFFLSFFSLSFFPSRYSSFVVVFSLWNTR